MRLFPARGLGTFFLVTYAGDCMCTAHLWRHRLYGLMADVVCAALWPLFHYHPGEMNFDEANWLAYRQANLKFAEAVRGMIRKNDMVWVQDYHLMLLPMLLRVLNDGVKPGSTDVERILEGIESEDFKPALIPRVKVGFFLHTPFPSSEIYR